MGNGEAIEYYYRVQYTVCIDVKNSLAESFYFTIGKVNTCETLSATQNKVH